jgi:hypothetical protein
MAAAEADFGTGKIHGAAPDALEEDLIGFRIRFGLGLGHRGSSIEGNHRPI